MKAREQAEQRRAEAESARAAEAAIAEKEREARRELEAARLLAENREREARSRLASAYVADGNRLMSTGRVVESLPRFLEASRLAPPDSHGQSVNRVRLRRVLDGYPTLVGFYADTEVCGESAISRDGRVAAFLSKGGGRVEPVVVDTVSGSRQLLKNPGVQFHNRWIAVSPTGDCIAVAATQAGSPYRVSRVLLWKQRGTEWEIESEHLQIDQAITCLAFGPLGKTLIAGTSDGTLRIWRESHEPQTIENNAPVGEILFTNDGQHLVGTTGWPVRALAHWILRSDRYEVAASLKVPAGSRNPPKLAGAANKLIWVVEKDGTLEAVVSPLSGEDSEVIQLAGSELTGYLGICVSQDADKLGLYKLSQPSSTRPTELSAYSLQSGERLLQTTGHDGPIQDASFNADASRIVTASGSLAKIAGRATIWDVAEGTMLCPPLANVLPAERAWFSPDSTKVVVSGHRYDGRANLFQILASELRTWNLNEERASVDPQDSKPVFSRDRDRALVLHEDEVCLLVRDLHTTQPVKHGATVAQAAFTSSGGTAVSIGEDLSICRWEVKDKDSLIKSATSRTWSEAFNSDEVRGWQLRSISVAIQESEELFATAVTYWKQDNDPSTAFYEYLGELRFWSLETLQPVGAPIALTDDVGRLSFSPDGKILAASQREPVARIQVNSSKLMSFAGRVWDVENRSAISPKIDTSKQVLCSLMCERGDRVLVGLGAIRQEHVREVECKVWDVRRAEWIGSPKDLPDNLSVVAFSREGRFVFGAGPTSARIIDVDSGTTVQRAELSYTRSACFSQDSRSLVTVDTSGSLKVWNPETGALSWETRPSGNVGALVSRSGDYILTGHSDGIMRLWDGANGEEIGPPLKGIIADDQMLSGDFTRLVSNESGALRLVEISPDQTQDNRLELLTALMSGIKSESDGRFTVLQPSELLLRWRSLANLNLNE